MSHICSNCELLSVDNYYGCKCQIIQIGPISPHICEAMAKGILLGTAQCHVHRRQDRRRVMTEEAMHHPGNRHAYVLALVR